MIQPFTLLIDNRDTFTYYGITLAKGSLSALLTVAPLKKLETIEWAEENGEQTDLSSPILDTRELRIKLNINSVEHALLLIDDLTNGAYHTFSIPELDAHFKLRFVSCTSYEGLNGLIVLTLSLADDFPPIVRPFAMTETEFEQWRPSFDPSVRFLTFLPLEQEQSTIPPQGYKIDDTDISRFGLKVLRGTANSIDKAPEIKNRQLQNSQWSYGIDYDPINTHFQAKDSTLKLLLRTTTISDFWRFWDTLFAILLQPQERVLTVGEKRFMGRYKACKVEDFELLSNGGIWCVFNLTIRINNVLTL